MLTTLAMLFIFLGLMTLSFNIPSLMLSAASMSGTALAAAFLASVGFTIVTSLHKKPA